MAWEVSTIHDAPAFRGPSCASSLSTAVAGGRAAAECGARAHAFAFQCVNAARTPRFQPPRPAPQASSGRDPRGRGEKPTLARFTGGVALHAADAGWLLGRALGRAGAAGSAATHDRGCDASRPARTA
ncbi:MAG: hypothetical protein U5L08_06505 [Xanthomonadales bacterium]|nr:hypothetical protein [Xanthomonadales bacterium]